MDNKQELAPAITVKADGVMKAIAAQAVLRSILATEELGSLRRFLEPLIDKIVVG